MPFFIFIGCIYDICCFNGKSLYGMLENMYFDKHYYISMNARFVMSALCAKEFYQRDVHYIVKDGAVQIVDEVLFLPFI